MLKYLNRLSSRSPQPLSVDKDHVDEDDGHSHGDHEDDEDIYIMMQCLSVTKNEHFLKRSVCLFVMFYPHFFKSRK